MKRRQIADHVPIEERNWVTPKEAAKIWGISLSTVYIALENGMLRAKRLFHIQDKKWALWAIEKGQPAPSLQGISISHGFEKKMKKRAESLKQLKF